MAGEPLSRRTFLGGAVALGAVALAPRPLRAPLLVRRGAGTVPVAPFTLGVASGEPTTTGVVLWTRLAPDPLARDGGMPSGHVPVRWEVASDERFRKVVRKGTTQAAPDAAHSVHVDVDGLEPGAEYFYRFVAGGEESPVGRTRTVPARPRSLAFAAASCQDYQSGLYVAHRHLAAEDLDAVLFLGDYIYEGGPKDGAIRVHEGPEVLDLPSYRRRYATYKADPDLQAAHAAHPWIVTWDDHEVDNNYAGAFEQEIATAEPAFVARRLLAYRAWWEHQPVRLRPPPATGTYRIHRRVSYGRLADVFVLDTRQYRTDQPCGPSVITAPCAGFDGPTGTILGAEQRTWLDEGLAKSAATWQVVAQGVMVAQSNFGAAAGAEILNLDEWDGYRADRDHLMKAFARAENPVVVTGDIHSAWANDLKADFDDPDSRTVGSELVGTSITSLFPLSDVVGAAAATQPHLRYFEGNRRGYVRLTLDADELRADFRYVSNASEPTATIETGASFVVEAGTPGPQPA